MTLKYGFWTQLTVFLASIPSGILRGYAFATLWAWFVVPLGAPMLGMAHAYGLGCLVTMATFQSPLPKDKQIAGGTVERSANGDEKFVYVFSMIWAMVVPPVFALCCGYVAKTVMVP